MKKSSQSGFAAIEAILVCVILGIIGFTGYFVWNAKQETDKSLNSSASSQQVSQASKKDASLLTYTDPVGNFSFSYPAEWTLEKSLKNVNTDTASSTVDLISADKTVTVHFGADQGGRGGECQPLANEKPFAAGNTCFSKEYLSSEPLDIKSVYYSREKTDASGKFTYSTQPSNIVLVTSHYAEPSGQQAYGIGVTNSNSDSPIKINTPTMGVYDIREFITVWDSKGTFKPYIYAYAESPDKSFLNGASAESIKDIFRSLTIDN